MAVRVMRTTASRGLRIFGSGTSSTRTSVVPNQQTAFISSPFIRRQKAESSRQPKRPYLEFEISNLKSVLTAYCFLPSAYRSYLPADAPRADERPFAGALRPEGWPSVVAI